MVKKKEAKNMLTLGEVLKKQGQELELDPKKVKALKQQQEKDNRKVSLLRSLFILDSHNNIKRNSIKNVVAILENDPLFKGAFQYNEFSEENEITKDISELHIKKGNFIDAYDDEIANYIESQEDYDHVFFDKNRIDSAINVVSRRNAFNPMLNYMNEAYNKWDKKRRLDDFFPIFLGVRKDETTTLITRLWFMGGVAKVYKPLTKIDFSLDLVGGQGVGKTTILQKTAPLDLYTDQFNTFTDKDDIGNLIGMFIVNDDEMTASSKASFEEIKKFLTDKHFKYRPSYARHTREFTKKFIFARTTNNETYLKDKTGTRRFMPLMAHKNLQKLSPVTDLTPEYVQQIWGEAVWLYKNAKDPFILTKGQETLLENHRKNFEYVDGAEEELADVLYNDFHNAEFISTHDLMFKLPLYQDKKIRYLMENVFNYKGNQKKYINGKQVRGFRKKH
jgi:predicted P-loop ATPase